VAGHGVLDIGGSVVSYISTPFSTTSNSRLDLEPLDNRGDNYFGGISKS
jgi:hypothetical protein